MFSDPCGDCSAPDYFCQLLPEPKCRPVVQPTCQNKDCAGDEICAELDDDTCRGATCPKKPTCGAEGDWHKVAEGLTGPHGARYGSAGGSTGGGSRAEALLGAKNGSGEVDKNADDEDDD